MASDMVFGSFGAIASLFNVLDGSTGGDRDYCVVGNVVAAVFQGSACIVVALDHPSWAPLELRSRVRHGLALDPHKSARRYSLGSSQANAVGHMGRIITLARND